VAPAILDGGGKYQTAAACILVVAAAVVAAAVIVEAGSLAGTTELISGAQYLSYPASHSTTPVAGPC
jgi:hypothetical protein